MTCPELISPGTPVATLRLPAYHLLHSEGRDLISGWFQRAWNARMCKAEDSFEPFIFAWFAVNGWATCISGVDEDHKYIKALMSDETICHDFARLSSEPSSPVASSAVEFARLWPVFEVKELRRSGIMRHSSGDRDVVIDGYLSAGARRFDPRCWKRHRDAGEQIPLDWPHTLKAIYRVRCNLFHGEKAAHSEMDQRVVSSAFRTLVHFIQEAGYLGTK